MACTIIEFFIYKILFRYPYKEVEEILSVTLSDDLGEDIGDGILLCRLVNSLHPNTISVIHTTKRGEVTIEQSIHNNNNYYYYHYYYSPQDHHWAKEDDEHCCIYSCL